MRPVSSEAFIPLLIWPPPLALLSGNGNDRVGSELRGEPPGRAPEEGVQKKKRCSYSALLVSMEHK